MKTFISILIILVGLLGGNRQQSKTAGYKSMAECGSDTLQYLLANFRDNERQYVGKKVEVLLNDLEFTIKDFGDRSTGIADTVTGFFICNLNPLEKHNKLDQGLPYYELVIDFKNPTHRTKDWSAARSKAGAYWRTPYIDLVKDQIIGNLMVVKSEWNGRYTEPTILSK